MVRLLYGQRIEWIIADMGAACTAENLIEPQRRKEREEKGETFAPFAVHLPLC
jgi:hypothetical protein